MLPQDGASQALPAPARMTTAPSTELDGRLIAVSNRVSRPAKGAAPGGLALALSEALQSRGGTWVGWSGATTHADDDGELDLTTVDDVTYAVMDIEAKAFAGFYEGYANGVLWPVFHGRPDLSDHDGSAYAAYREVNRRFGAAVARVAAVDDVVWVHDYHFLPLAEELRRIGLTNSVGLFLHIPFPHEQLFRAVPEAVELARALTHYDTIAVQTRRDATNLAEALAALSEGVVRETGDGMVATAWGRTVLVTAAPIGIDVAGLRGQLRAPAPAEVARYLSGLDGRASLIGIDRLDYSKGIPQRLEAYYRYLGADPERASRTVFTQIAPISRGAVRAYAETRREVELIAGRIAGQFATLDGSPLRLLTRAYERRAVAHLMASADVGLVTPLADGMNLVAKEFVAVQDAADPGVLVLSEFAGAAEAMTEAVLVNPHDVDGMAEAIDRALTMPLAERRERHASLMDVVYDTAITRWTDRCIASLAAA